MYEQLKKAVYLANVELELKKLVICNWGNVSGIDRKAGIVVIKPSGVPYNELMPDKMVVVSLDGKKIEGDLNPSSDTPTHLELYRNFKEIGGICHTHSCYATMWSQACREIPCFGTTHADYFYGAVPVTEQLTDDEIKTDYELNTGRVIVRRFAGIAPTSMPAVLVAGHGPFTWGATPMASVESAMVLEEVAKMAAGTIAVNPQQKAVRQTLLDKHYLRKHGKDAYYGQK
ncbi:MAG: L-ribulose-5-phosphate 4-epimerase [Phycisphaerae bacterium]|jgi:L-ribulose-5-phosphate 4-epimerase